MSVKHAAVLLQGSSSAFARIAPWTMQTDIARRKLRRCRSSLSSYDSFDSAAFCRQRFWLFVAYVVSFASIIGASAMLLKHMAAGGGHAEPHVKWTGWVRATSTRRIVRLECVVQVL